MKCTFEASLLESNILLMWLEGGGCNQTSDDHAKSSLLVDFFEQFKMENFHMMMYSAKFLILKKKKKPILAYVIERVCDPCHMVKYTMTSLA